MNMERILAVTQKQQIHQSEMEKYNTEGWKSHQAKMKYSENVA